MRATSCSNRTILLLCLRAGGKGCPTRLRGAVGGDNLVVLKLGALGHRYSALFNALKLVAKRMRLSAHDTHMLFHGTAERVYSLDGNDYVCLSQPAEIPDTSFPEFAWRLMVLLGIVCVGVLVLVIL